VVLRAYRLPAGRRIVLHDTLKTEARDLRRTGRFVDELFRISTMGALTSVDIDRLIASTRDRALSLIL